MANTFTPISTVTVGSGGAATIDFTNIPSSYTDLCLKISVRAAATNWTTTAVRITFNTVGGTSYTRKTMYNTSAGSAGSDSASGVAFLGGIGGQGSSSTGSVFAIADFYIPNYAGSAYKTVSINSISENNGTDTAQQMTAGMFSNTSAISSISIVDAFGNFNQYSTVALYGIKNS